MAWKKVSDKLYQVEIEGRWTDIDVPFGKVEKIVEAFFANGGMITPEGKVSTNIGVLIANFGVLGDILLSKYDDKGRLVEEKGCRSLSPKEVPELFKVASDVISNFMQVISEGMAEMTGEQVGDSQPEKPEQKKKTEAE